MEIIKVTFPDGSIHEFEKGIKILDVAINFSNLGIKPMFANSSSKHLTWTGNRPPYTSSALSHNKKNRNEEIINHGKCRIATCFLR